MTKLNQLVLSPLTKFNKLTGKDGALSQHNTHIYHVNAVSSAAAFVSNIEKPELDIHNQINQQRKELVLENRKRLIPIVQSIIFLGRQNISLRGHRDDSAIQEDSTANEGNFRALLRYRSSYDPDLSDQLKNFNSKATYISKTTQNDLIALLR